LEIKNVIISVPKKRKIIVKKRKLGREKCWGQAFIGEDFCEVDERLRGKRKLRIFTHEICHLLWPDDSENQIDKKSIVLTDALWKEGYRQIDNLLF
jgi:hypothetical protein